MSLLSQGNCRRIAHPQAEKKAATPTFLEALYRIFFHMLGNFPPWDVVISMSATLGRNLADSKFTDITTRWSQNNQSGKLLQTNK